VFQGSASAAAHNSNVFPILAANFHQSVTMLQHLHATLLDQAQQLATPNPTPPYPQAHQQQHQKLQQQPQQLQIDSEAIAADIVTVLQALDALTQSLSTSLSMLHASGNLPQQHLEPDPTSQLLAINLSNSITVLGLARSSLSRQIQLLTTHLHDALRVG
jgi:hypothetical protein